MGNVARWGEGLRFLLGAAATLLVVSSGCSGAEEGESPSCETACAHIVEKCGAKASCVSTCKGVQLDAAAKGCSGAYDLVEECCSGSLPSNLGNGGPSCGSFDIVCKNVCSAEWNALTQCTASGSGGSGGSGGSTGGSGGSTGGSGGSTGGSGGTSTQKCAGAGPTYFTQEGLPCGGNPTAPQQCTLKLGGWNYGCDGKTCTWKLYTNCQCCCPGKPCTVPCSKEGGTCGGCSFC